MTRVTQGARQRHFILLFWFRVDVMNLKHSVRYDESLVMSIFEKPDFTQANYMLISGFMIVGQL